MRGFSPKNAVLVLSTAAPEATRIGMAVLGIPGVSGVTADPARGQVVIRYDAERVNAERIRSAARLSVDDGGDDGFWLSAWPRLASALPTAASLL